ncbi:MAG: FHA domain-containing protein [Cellulosilyticaceae bacterium]
MIQNTINLASYAIAGAVAFALVGVIGVFLMRSVIKNLRNDGIDEAESLERETAKEKVSKEKVSKEKVSKEKVSKEDKQPKVVSNHKEVSRPQVISQPKAKQIIFTKLSNNVVGESFAIMLEDSLNIGRVKEKNDWAIESDHTVSSKHCKIYIADEKIYLIDLNSTNGTYVNQIRITHPVALKDNDLIRMGSGEYSIMIRE